MKAPKKITALPTVTTIKNADWFAVVQDGITSKVSFSALNDALGDEWITGGTYNPSDGCATFSSNSAHTFVVCGFLTGYTDAYTYTATTSGNSIVFDNTLFGTNYYNVDLTPILSGNTFSGGSGNCITDLYVTNIHGCSPVTFHSQLQHIGSSATGLNSIAWGSGTTAIGKSSHAEGTSTSATTNNSHAEGVETLSSGIYLPAPTFQGSHAEGYQTKATGFASHTEGLGTIASGLASHAEGQETNASGNNSHSVGAWTNATGFATHAGGAGHDIDNPIIASGDTSFIHFKQYNGPPLLHTPGSFSDYSAILGGKNHFITKDSEGSVILGGDDTYISGGTYSTVIGGYENIIRGDMTNTTIIGGLHNEITNIDSARNNNTIIGAEESVINNTNGSSIFGGRYHLNSAPLGPFPIPYVNVIVGGERNRIDGAFHSGIFAGGGAPTGDGNVILSGVSRTAIVGGKRITGTTDDTVYVPNLNIGTVGSGPSEFNLGIDSSGFVVTGSTSSGSTFSWSDPVVKSGNTSGDCISQLWVHAISGCSDLFIGTDGDIHLQTTSADTFTGRTSVLINELAQIGVGTLTPFSWIPGMTGRGIEIHNDDSNNKIPFALTELGIQRWYIETDFQDPFNPVQIKGSNDVNLMTWFTSQSAPRLGVGTTDPQGTFHLSRNGGVARQSKYPDETNIVINNTSAGWTGASESTPNKSSLRLDHTLTERVGGLIASVRTPEWDSFGPGSGSTTLEIWNASGDTLYKRIEIEPDGTTTISGDGRVTGSLNIGNVLTTTPQFNLGLDASGFVTTGVTGSTTYWEVGSGLKDTLGSHTITSGALTDFSIIAGGESNEITTVFSLSTHNAILGGKDNIIHANVQNQRYNAIIGGEGNEIGHTTFSNASDGSAIIGGNDNKIYGAANNCVLIGHEAFSAQGVSNCVFIPALNIGNQPNLIGTATTGLIYAPTNGGMISGDISTSYGGHGFTDTGSPRVINKDGDESMALCIDHPYLGAIDYKNIGGRDEIFKFGVTTSAGTTGLTTSFGTGEAIGMILNSDSSKIASGVTRSVIIGGSNITATTSDTVYVPNLDLCAFSGTLFTSSISGCSPIEMGYGVNVQGPLTVDGVSPFIIPFTTLTPGDSVVWDFNVSGENAKLTPSVGATAINQIIATNFSNGAHGYLIIDPVNTTLFRLPTNSFIKNGDAEPSSNNDTKYSYIYDGTNFWWSVEENLITPIYPNFITTNCFGQWLPETYSSAIFSATTYSGYVSNGSTWINSYTDSAIIGDLSANVSLESVGYVVQDIATSTPAHFTYSNTVLISDRSFVRSSIPSGNIMGSDWVGVLWIKNGGTSTTFKGLMDGDMDDDESIYIEGNEIAAYESTSGLYHKSNFPQLTGIYADVWVYVSIEFDHESQQIKYCIGCQETLDNAGGTITGADSTPINIEADGTYQFTLSVTLNEGSWDDFVIGSANHTGFPYPFLDGSIGQCALYEGHQSFADMATNFNNTRETYYIT